MKANELRIGNWVFDLEEKENTEVIQWTFESDYFTSLEPIPLTEEWLIKFGFTVLYGEGIAKGWLHKGLIQYCLTGGSVCYNYNNLTRVESVHQLQNIYFALTNEELTIKL